ncbi:MAG: hypothetical protein ACQEUN_08115 [Pseudomonadota bacterium]
MKINDDHMYHGAALTQVAEHEQFTAINAFESGYGISRSSFLINHDVGLFIKYATNPKGPYKEYVFTFNNSHLKELEEVEARSNRTFIALVCVKDRQVCCLSKEELSKMVEEREQEKGAKEASYNVLVTCPKNKKLRAYMNAPGKKKTKLTDHLLSRNAFPGVLFEKL